MKQFYKGFFAIVLLTVSLYSTFGQVKAIRSIRNLNTVLTPFVDHHQHLFSPDKAKAASDEPLPVIELPDEFVRLLREREKAWNNKIALSPLFTEDSLFLNSADKEAPYWVRGRNAVSEELSGFFRRPFQIAPFAFHLDGANGYIAGYYTRNIDNSVRYIGQVFLSLTRNNDGKWLIAAENPVTPGPYAMSSSNADQLIAQLDEAGIQRAVVLSVAYQWGSSVDLKAGEYERVKAENDYIALQVSRYPKRLTGFCSFNPLKDYALQELERCQKDLHLKGLKLHFGNSYVELKNVEHVKKVQQIFAAANARQMPIVVHLWTDPNYEKEGKIYAQIFLGQILPKAPEVTIQIAHMAGGGRSAPLAMEVYADAIAANDRRTKNVYFDVATLTEGETLEGLKKDAALMRKIGLQRFLYGTDAAPPNPRAWTSWGHFKGLMPLTDKELGIITSNVAPYLR